jgi:DNA-binding transcriptional ArsR family regulator
MAEEPRNVDLDARQLRVLAHPLRARLLARLRLDGPATATKLAEALGTNTGATSYHLRQLADAGLVLEEPGAGHGRQRWWRPAHDMSTWRRGTYAGDDNATAAVDWLNTFALNVLVDQVEAWHRAEPSEPPQWREATDLSDYALNLTAPRLRDLTGELESVIERYRQAAADADDPEARKVLIYVYAVPHLAER